MSDPLNLDGELTPEQVVEAGALLRAFIGADKENSPMWTMLRSPLMEAIERGEFEP